MFEENHAKLRPDNFDVYMELECRFRYKTCQRITFFSTEKNNVVLRETDE